jgi:hypothetical protein
MYDTYADLDKKYDITNKAYAAKEEAQHKVDNFTVITYKVQWQEVDQKYDLSHKAEAAKREVCGRDGSLDLC